MNERRIHRSAWSLDKWGPVEDRSLRNDFDWWFAPLGPRIRLHAKRQAPIIPRGRIRRQTLELKCLPGSKFLYNPRGVELGLKDKGPSLSCGCHEGGMVDCQSNRVAGRYGMS